MIDFNITTLIFLGLSTLAVFFLGMIAFYFERATGLFASILGMFQEVFNG